MKTAVSLTPLALEADSRTYRIARSLAAFGFRSVVIEGQASRNRFWGGDEIDVVSPAPGRAPGMPSGASSGKRRGVIAALREGRAGGVGELLLYAGFRGRHWLRYERGAERRFPIADLYYLHSFELYRATAAAARRCGAPVIYDAHDFYRGIEPSASRPSFDRNRMRPFLDGREDEALAGAAAIVTVSEGVAGLIEGVCGRRPMVVHNAHDERLDRAPKTDLRTSLGLGPDDRLAVVVGNYKSGMAVDAALAALAQLPDRFHLAFLGRGYEALTDRGASENIRARLHLGRFFAPDEVVPAIRSADLGLVLYEPYSENYRFALPNGFFQVVAAGLPLVRGYLPEIETAIGERIVGECLPQIEPASLAQAILRCTEREAKLRPAMAELADTLSWRHDAERLKALVSHVMDPSSAPSIADRTPSSVKLSCAA